MVRISETAWGGVGVLLLGAALACSGGARREAPPAAGAPATSAPVAQVDTPTPIPLAAGGAIDLLTRPKLSDQEYMAAIAVLEGANGTTDAAADIEAGLRRVLAVPRPGLPSRLPGVKVPRERIPADVRFVKIEGFVEDSDNRHVIRFGMLAMRYAEAYNAIMVRGVQ